MTENLDVLFGQASQVVHFDCPEGRPSSVTSVTCYEDTSSDTGQTESAITGSPSVESVNLTLNAASGKSETDPTLINLAAVTGLVRGRQFLLTAATGESEWVEIARIDSTGTSAYTRSPMVHDYTTAATLQSTRLTATIDTTWASDENNLSDPCDTSPRYRLAWLYTVAGVVYRATSFFDLVRYPRQVTVTPQDVNDLWRSWGAHLHPDSLIGAGEADIREARRRVAVDLIGHRLAEAAIRNTRLRFECLRWKAVVVILEGALFAGGQPGTPEALARAEKEYWATFNRLVQNTNVQVTEDGAAEKRTLNPVWRR